SPCSGSRSATGSPSRRLRGRTVSGTSARFASGRRCAFHPSAEPTIRASARAGFRSEIRHEPPRASFPIGKHEPGDRGVAYCLTPGKYWFEHGSARCSSSGVVLATMPVPCRRLLPLRVPLLLAGALLLVAPSAGAEPTATELAVARRLFREATQLEERQRWDLAAQKLREAIRIKETPGLRFHLAHCQENMGLLV